RLLAQRREPSAELAHAANLVGRIARHRGVRPKAEPDHLVDDHLVLATASDSLVELFAVAGRASGGHRNRCVADGYLRLRLGLDGSARGAGGTTGCLRFSRKPSRKLLVVPGGHTVLSEPVRYARMVRKDGDAPPGLQGLGPSAT